jgi:hypothetical protein
MKKSLKRWIIFIVLALAGIAVAGIFVYLNGRPLQVPMKTRLYDGVTYERQVRFLPRPLMIHVIVIDTKNARLRFLVTPPDDLNGKYPLRARTTTQFMQEFGAQIAINGDGFVPWWSNSILDYYPHVGDPVAPLGPAASLGKIYWRSDKPAPTLYISRRGEFSFIAPDNPYNAISGDSYLIKGGNVVDDLDNAALQPRTAIGFSSNGRFIYLAVVDGRQPFYSEGVTRKELADLMKSFGAYYAINMDGGGSSTLVVEENGKPKILNSPIDKGIPGRERAVANHLGIFIDK